MRLKQLQEQKKKVISKEFKISYIKKNSVENTNQLEITNKKNYKIDNDFEAKRKEEEKKLS